MKKIKLFFLKAQLLTSLTKITAKPGSIVQAYPSSINNRLNENSKNKEIFTEKASTNKNNKNSKEFENNNQTKSTQRKITRKQTISHYTSPEKANYFQSMNQRCHSQKQTLVDETKNNLEEDNFEPINNLFDSKITQNKSHQSNKDTKNNLNKEDDNQFPACITTLSDCEQELLSHIKFKTTNFKQLI